jgi:hypothetical protein
MALRYRGSEFSKQKRIWSFSRMSSPSCRILYLGRMRKPRRRVPDVDREDGPDAALEVRRQRVVDHGLELDRVGGAAHAAGAEVAMAPRPDPQDGDLGVVLQEAIALTIDSSNQVRVHAFITGGTARGGNK